MPGRDQYPPRLRAALDEAEQRYMAAATAYTEALLDQDVIARLMPYRPIDYPDGEYPVAPLTRAYPGGPLTPLHLAGALARHHPQAAGERVQQRHAELKAVEEEYAVLLEKDPELQWEPDPADAIEPEAG